MRSPGSPTPENTLRALPEGAPRIHTPDRQRIDSDVRAFLREPSTPWIVFDREGRPPSHLAVGELLPASRVSLMSSPQFFPPGSPSLTTEPSSLAVASDLGVVPVADLEPEPLHSTSSGRLLKVGALAAGMLSVLGVAAFALGESTDVQTTHVSSGAMPADVAPPDLDPKLPPTQAITPVAPVAPAPAKADDPRMKFGRISIAGTRDVFLDGKRLLGRGARSFVVTCGSHTVAVGTRDGGEAVDVPCNGEYVVAR